MINYPKSKDYCDTYKVDKVDIDNFHEDCGSADNVIVT